MKLASNGIAPPLKPPDNPYMKSTPLPPSLLESLKKSLPDGCFIQDPATCLSYAYDNSRRQALPQAVALVDRHEQVVSIVRACHQHRVALTARGRGTNTTGATVPIAGGVVISFERMTRILRIAPEDRIAVVEPGVLNADLQAAIAPSGFFWPPDPTSAPYCSIGGNLACNAGGPRAVKYGATRDNVLGLRAVSGDGREFRCGGTTTKGATGYDLTRLLIGSEGTLALITEATLKLTPRAEALATLRAEFSDVSAAAAAVARIMAQAVTPCALEFLDDACLDLARQREPEVLPNDTGALLMIEVDGQAATLEHAVKAVSKAAAGKGLLRLQVASDRGEAAQLWRVRKALSPALRDLSPHKINEDVVVPVSQVPALIQATRELASRFEFPIVSFGHAGNGNLHVNLLPRNTAELARAEDCLASLFATVIELGGTLSGEHGIGLSKRDFMPQAVDPNALHLMQALKQSFDPHGILNPGKLLP